MKIRLEERECENGILKKDLVIDQYRVDLIRIKILRAVILYHLVTQCDFKAHVFFFCN